MDYEITVYPWPPGVGFAGKAVSYTHLDVYKRQVLYTVRSKKAEDESIDIEIIE